MLRAGEQLTGASTHFFTAESREGHAVGTQQIGEEAFPYAATILRVPPASMRAQERLLFFYKGALAYKRCRPGLLGWLERAQIRLGAYGPDGAARQRDLEEFEGDCALAAIHA